MLACTHIKNVAKITEEILRASRVPLVRGSLLYVENRSKVNNTHRDSSSPFFYPSKRVNFFRRFGREGNVCVGRPGGLQGPGTCS